MERSAYYSTRAQRALVLGLVALRTGQILNQSEFARDAKLPVSTVSRYLGLLEAPFLVARLTPFHEEARSSQVHALPFLGADRAAGRRSLRHGQVLMAKDRQTDSGIHEPRGTARSPRFHSHSW
jgi:hypothetical protein